MKTAPAEFASRRRAELIHAWMRPMKVRLRIRSLMSIDGNFVQADFIFSNHYGSFRVSVSKRGMKIADPVLADNSISTSTP